MATPGGGEVLDRDFLTSESESEGEGWLDVPVGSVGMSALTPARAAAAKLAKAVYNSPAKSSHRCAVAFGGAVE